MINLYEKTIGCFKHDFRLTKRIAFILLMLLFVINVQAQMQESRTVELTQPNGSKFSAVLFGDRFLSKHETPDGYTILKNDKGWWVYATQNKDGSLVATDQVVNTKEKRVKSESTLIKSLMPHLDVADDQKKEAENLRQQYEIQLAKILDDLTSGGTEPLPSKWKVCVILIKFPDLANKYTKDQMSNLFNEVGFSGGFNSHGSFYDYYKEASFGKFEITADVFGWYTAANNKPYYAWNGPDPWGRSQQLIVDAIDKADADIDFSKYDNNKDGQVESVIMLHAGHGAAEAGDEQYIWPHQFWLPAPITRDGVKINNYTNQEELQYNRYIGVGMLAHEFGHSLGLPDLYGAGGLGNFCLMASAAWLNSGSDPSLFSIWCKIKLGWVKPNIINQSGFYTIKPGVFDETQYYQINSPTSPNEYYLLENRQLLGWDSKLPGHGLTIYHCTKNASGLSAVHLEEADGLRQIALEQNRGDAGDTYPGSTNNVRYDFQSKPSSKLKSGADSQVSLYNISESNGNIAFYLKIGSSNDIIPPVAKPNGPYISPLEQPIQFSSAGSFDPDGIIYSYKWDFGDGATSSEPNPTHKYNDYGTYTATLFVTDNGGIQANAKATVTVSNLPAGWVTKDIGSIAMPGSSRYENGVFWCSGAGANILDYKDAFTFTYKEVTGDFEITAHNAFGLMAKENTKIGLMVREALSDSSKMVSVIVRPGRGSAFIGREITGGAASYVSPEDGRKAPQWLKIIRSGNNFSCFVSSDRVNWQQNGPTLNWQMSQTLYIGMCVASCDVAKYANATFNYLTIKQSSNYTPVAIANGSYMGYASKSISFTSVNSFDYDGTIVSYSWDFGDGASSNEANPIHTYTTPGSFTAKLTVTDNNGASSEAIAKVTVKETSPLPDGWSEQNVGPLKIQGQVTYDNGTFVLTGSGINLYDEDDEFYYVYKKISGDGEVITKVTSNVSPITWNKVGVMFRENLSSFSKYIHNGFRHDGRIVYNYRTITAAESGNVALNQAGPVWLKLSRSGDTFSIFYSANGTTWVEYGVETIPMTTDIYAGIYVCSYSITDVCTSTFTDVIVNDGATNQPPVVNINGSYTGVKNQPVNFLSNGTVDNDGSIASYLWSFGDGTTSTAANPVKTFTTPGSFNVTLKVIDNQGYSKSKSTIALISDILPQTPYSGQAITIPGRIEVENFDIGGFGVAYLDQDIVNEGSTYRTTEGVDIKQTKDTEGNYEIGWTKPGEWLEYTVNIPNGEYNFYVRFFSFNPNCNLKLSLDGQDLGTLVLTGTGTENWTTAELKNVSVTNGGDNKVLRVSIMTVGDINLNYIDIIPSSNQFPVVNIHGPYTVAKGTPLVFDVSGTSDPDGTLTKTTWFFGDGTTANTLNATHTYSAPGYYQAKLVVEDNIFAKTEKSVAVWVTSDQAQTPYGGYKRIIPGRIEAEEFDNGGYLISYYDKSNTNEGGAMRTSDMVDIEATPDIDGAYNVGWVVDGEWLEYTLDVNPGVYTFNARVNWAYNNKIEASIDGRLITTLSLENTNAPWKTCTIKNITITESGEHVLRIKAIGSDFNVNWVEFVKEGNIAPTAVLDGVTEAKANEEISFSAARSSDSDGSIIDYTWSFGDNSISKEISPKHTYISPGTYKVSLSITDNGGALVKKVIYVAIAGNNPQTPYMGNKMTIPGIIEVENYDNGGVGVAYSDRDAANLGNIYRTDGVDVQTCNDSGGGYNLGWVTNGEWVEYTTDCTEGVYNITLRFANNMTKGDVIVKLDGQTIATLTMFNTGGWDKWVSYTLKDVPVSGGANKVLRLEFSNPDEDWLGNINYISFIAETQAPIAEANGPYTAEVGLPVRLSSAGSTDPDGTIIRYKWNLGNGTTISEQSPQVVYNLAGTYNVSLTVFDNKGASSTDNATVTVIKSQNKKPFISINGPYSSEKEFDISFSSTGSNDVDGTISGYLWNFGDGATSTEQNPKHSYANAGDYTVTLEITDNDGAKSNTTTNATISEHQDLPSPWVKYNIGNQTGTDVFYSNGIFKVKSLSDDRYSEFALHPLNGDGYIVARITDIQSTSDWSKAYLVMRPSLNASDDNHFVAFGFYKSSFGVDFFYNNGSSVNTIIGLWELKLSLPYWLKLERVGNLVKGYSSIDGINWTSRGEVAVTLPTNSYIGIYGRANDGNNFAYSVFDNVSVAQGADLISPSTPSALTTSNLTETSVKLNWGVSSDNIGVSEYQVFVNDKMIASTANNNFDLTGLSATNTYSIYVLAKDAAGNVSPKSNTVTVIAPDLTKPTAPTALTYSNQVGNTVDLSWDASTDNVFLSGYLIYVDGIQFTGSTTNTIKLAGLASFHTSSIVVKAIDLFGNISDPSNLVQVSTPDVDKPTKPTNLSVTAFDESSITIQWSASTDNDVVDKYRVFVDNTFVADVAANAILTYTINGLTSNTLYAIKVAAVDLSNNESLPALINATTKDTQRPPKPTGVNVSKIEGTRAMLTWNPVADNLSDVTYNVYVDGSSLGTTKQTQIRISELDSYKDYSVYIVAKDEQNNQSDPSDAVTFRTLDIIAPSVPQNLTASNVAVNSVDLSWIASTDNAPLITYEVFLGIQKVGTTTATSIHVENLVASPVFTFTVRAVDNSGNASAFSTAANVHNDFENPTVPSGLLASGITYNSFNITWNASTDNVGVKEYELTLNGNVAGRSVQPQYSFTNLLFGHYEVKVAAIDISGNRSSNSDLLSVSLIDNQAPTAPTNLAVSNITATGCILTWTPSSDNVGVSEYDIYNGTTVIASVSTATATISGLNTVTNYTFTIKAKDASGNVSEGSSALIVTTLDNIAPSSPSSLTASNVTAVGLTLAWNASSDNVGVVEYDVYNGSTLAASVSTTTAMISGLTTATKYTFTVKAKDAAGNVSEHSNELNITTLDNITPSAPNSLAASNVTANGFTLTWNASFDNVGVVEYDVYNGATLATSVSSTIAIFTGLSAATEYTLKVKAKDAAGNVSEASSPLIVNTLSTGLDNPLSLNSADVIISPNPNDGKFTVNLEGLDEKCVIRIYTSIGQFLQEIQVNNGDTKIPVCIKGTPGIYLLRVTSGKQQICKQLIVK